MHSEITLYGDRFMLVDEHEAILARVRREAREKLLSKEAYERANEVLEDEGLHAALTAAGDIAFAIPDAEKASKPRTRDGVRS